MNPDGGCQMFGVATARVGQMSGCVPSGKMNGAVVWQTAGCSIEE